jgi:hypothetical protein
MKKLIKTGAASAIALLAACGAASAAENVSGDIGYNINSHFISYGVDVWGAGGSFFGDRSTSSIYGDLAVKVTPSLTWTLNAWTDINSNVPSAIGGSLQEVDLNTGFSYALGGGVTASAVYGAWSYAGDVEEILDFSLGYDDTGTIFSGFAFNPKLTWHYRASGNGTQAVGSAVVLSVSPSFPLGGGFSLGIPAGVAFFTTDTFQGGTEGGIGYGYFGGSLGVPLSFIPSSYGAWSANFDLIAYFTNSSAIPTNPESDFVTGSFNIKLAF